MFIGASAQMHICENIFIVVSAFVIRTSCELTKRIKLI